jgi:hypothetical protein
MQTIVFILFVFSVATASSAPRDTSIRKTDWQKYFTSTNEFSADTGASFNNEIYYSYAKDSNAGGYPDLEQISYGDLGGDGKEMAVIPFESGGTAGSMNFFVFEQTKEGPHVLDHEYGYKLWTEIIHDTLLLHQPYYVGWEPNCCPQSIVTTWYRIKERKLDSLKIYAEGIPESASLSVTQFYELISSQQYKDAYDMLGEKYHERHPYKKWLEGYSNTISTDADVDTLRTSDSTVHVKLIAKNYHLDADPTTSEFEGTWKLEWVSTKAGWVLAEGHLREKKKK